MTYDSLILQFTSYSDERVTELLRTEKNKSGWTNSRAIYISALKQVATNKGIIGSLNK